MRNTRTLLGAVVIVLALIAAGVGANASGAWYLGAFDGSNTVFKTGKLRLEITGAPLAAENLAPGDPYAAMGVFCVRNTGSLPLEYSGRLQYPRPLQAGMLAFVDLMVENQSGQDWTVTNEFLAGQASRLPALWRYVLPALWSPNQAIVRGTLIPGQEQCYRVSARLVGETPNRYQNTTVHFYVVLHGVQARGAR
jgi:hypothetical protein